MKFRRQIYLRFWRTLNYLSIYAFIIVVYSAFFFTEYLLLREVEKFLHEDVEKFPLVSIWFDNARIGLAFLIMIVAFTHTVIATVSQMRIDATISSEEEKQ